MSASASLPAPRRSRRRRRIACALALLGAGLALTARSAPAEEGRARDVAVILSLEGPIDALTERGLELRMRQAMARSPRIVIVSVNSPGGEYEASRTIAWNLARLSEEGVATVAHIRGHALSGATMVAFGCDAIAIGPGSQLGDVMPIRISLLEGAPEVAEKMIAPVRKDLEHLAAERGYPLDAAAAMVDPRVELRRIEAEGPDGRIRSRYITRENLDAMPGALRSRLLANEVVCPAGQLLVVGPAEALDMGIARYEVADEAELLAVLARERSIPALQAIHLPAVWWEQVVRWVTWWPIKILLFALGMVALAAALSTPGLGLPEAVVVLAFGAVFFGSYLMGLADWIEPILFLCGLALLAVEIFLLPGFGVAGAAGVLAIGAALLLSFQTFVVPGDPVEWELLGGNLVKTLGGAALALAGLALAVRFLPGRGPFAALVASHVQPAAPEPSRSEVLVPVGARCVAVTTLRPVGRVRVGDETFDAVCERGLIERGTALVVVGHRGNELVVVPRPETALLAAREPAAPERPSPPRDDDPPAAAGDDAPPGERGGEVEGAPPDAPGVAAED